MALYTRDFGFIVVVLSTVNTLGAIVFLGALAVAGIVLSTMVFPFWNFIREDITEEVEIFESANGNCYVDTLDGIPKTIENCNLPLGSIVTVKYGEGLPWATIEP